MLDDLGLIPTLRWFVNQFQERNGIQVHFSVEGVAVVNIPNQVAVSMYRVFQEALNNITKHADASSVHVRLETSGNSISLEVKDDGRGFDTSEMKQREPGASGLGLIGMQERLDLVEGSMSIHSTRNVGTTLRADVPIQGVLRGYN